MNIEPDPAKNSILRLKIYFNSICARIIPRIATDPLFKGILIVGSGTAIAQILGIIFVPIITRIYPPAIYGTLAVFTSLLSILIIFGSFKYETTISIPEKDEDAEYLFIISFLILFVLTIILFILLILFGNFFAGIFHFEFIKPYYWLFCVGFFVSSLYQILFFWAIRSKDYITITQTKIAQSFGGSVSKIILGILYLGSIGLICGELIGRTCGISSLGRAILPRVWLTIHNINFHKLRSLAFEYKKFPAFSLPAGIINEISLQIPILFISSIFGFQIAGLYSLSYSITILPVSYISNAIIPAYSAETSELFRNKSDEILVIYKKTTKKLFLYGAPLILIGAIISPMLFPIIFGSAWKDAGVFVLPLSIMVVAHFVVNSTDRLELYGYNHWELVWNICRTFLVISGFYFSFILKLSPLTTIWVFSLTMTIMYSISYILNIKAIQLAIGKYEFSSKK